MDHAPIAVETPGAEPQNAGARTLILALVAAVAVGGLLFSISQDEAASVKPPKTQLAAKDLFGAEARCAKAQGESPEHRALAAFGAAYAKKQRAPFEPADGVESVALLEEAGVCFEEAGRSGRAAEAKQQAKEWQTEIWRAFQGHQLRLGLARENGQLEAALTEVRALRALWGKKGGEFGEWVRLSEAETEQKLQNAAKE